MDDNWFKEDWGAEDNYAEFPYTPVASLLQEESQKLRDWRNWFLQSHEEAMKIPMWNDNWAKE
jgi:hypothetical protein